MTAKSSMINEVWFCFFFLFLLFFVFLLLFFTNDSEIVTSLNRNHAFKSITLLFT